MNTNIIEQRKSLTLKLQFAITKGTYVVPFYVEFIPDELIVRTVSYDNDSTEGGISFIRTNLTRDNNILCVISDSIFVNPNSIFTLQKPINGDFNFQIINVSNVLVTTRAGVFSVGLEFVKYKDVKPEKIY